MTDPDAQALAIYDLMCSTSGNRPFSGNTIEELTRNIQAWQASNPALNILQESEPTVHLAFLKQSFEWLKVNADVRGNFRLCQTLSDAINFSLRAYPQPLPSDVILLLVSQYRQVYSMARLYFPFDLLLSRFTRDEVTDEIREELRKIHLQLAPSPTGKIDPRAAATRDRIRDLTFVEGEKTLDPGRGPWSQIVFDELEAREPIVRSGWKALLAHCESLQQQKPSAKWKKKANELANALSTEDVASTLLRWLKLGPAPGQPSEARSPIEDSQYQKGVVWCFAFLHKQGAEEAIADFGLACLRKIRMVGAVSQKVGLACVQCLGTIASREAISQLTKMRAKIKYSVALSLIEKALRSAAGELGVTVHELEDYAVEGYGLDERGSARFEIGNIQARIQLFEDGRVRVTWFNDEGKMIKSVPSRVKKELPSQVRSVTAAAKELEQAYRSQRFRLEASLLETRTMGPTHWRQFFVEHQLLGLLGRRLIWVFRTAEGSEQSALWLDGLLRDSLGQPVDVSSCHEVRLWHPLSTDSVEVQRWRDLVFKQGIRQPFPQAFREFYQMTDADRETRFYSNRFAGVLMRQHQFASLCKERGWDYRLMGAHFDGFNVPNKKLDRWKMHGEFYVDLPSDRNSALLESGLGEQSQTGINIFVGSDQVRFYLEQREIAIDEVPVIVYSEIMRDVDLFTSVCAVGDDETWSDQGDRGLGLILKRLDMDEVTATVALRADLLSRILARTRIANQCNVTKSWLEVRGQLGTYRVHLGWSSAALMTDTGARWIRIPQKLLSEIELDLGDVTVDLGHRTEQALRMAYLLADDWKIDSPDFVRQLTPE